MNKEICLILLILTCLHLYPQQFGKTFKKDFLLFKEAKRDYPYLVINDSVLIKNLDFSKPTYVKFPKGLSLRNFNKYQYVIDGKNYFVENGGGPVICFENDTFTRIDNTFSHKNQYGAVPFAHNNELYLWGGYGLFTGKKILLKFNFKKGTWQKVTTKNFHLIQQRQDALHIKDNNLLYIFGGTVFSDNNFTFDAPYEDHMHILDLDSMGWAIGKELKPQLNELAYKNEYGLSFMANKELVGFNNKDSDLIYILNIDTNLLSIYANNETKPIIKVIFSDNNQLVTYITEEANGLYTIQQRDLSNLMGKQVDVYELFKPEYKKYITYTLAFFAGFLSLFILSKKNKSYLRIYKKNTLVIDTKKQTVYFNKNKLKIYDENIFRVLEYLSITNKFKELSKINDLIAKENDNYAAILKRRELVLKKLRRKLSKLMRVDEEDIFVFKKHEDDKRIKLVKLKVKSCKI